ncbi:MAG: twin-arginine translocation signal domain-containing protein [Caldilineae bacterium]|nr:MAG: twin-arginine translocation signal domain-containing protein [Caldilineae bacterium]
MSSKLVSRRDVLRFTGAAVGAGVVASIIEACAPPAAPSVAQPTPEEAAKPAAQGPAAGMYFRLVTHGGDDPFWAVVKQGMMDAAELYGCRAEIDLAGSDLANQQKKFQEAVASKPDGIALVINNDDAWDKPVEDALAAGIPVIGINNDDTKGAAGNKRLCYIGQNERRAGYMLGTKLFSTAVEKGMDLTNAKIAMAAEVPTAAYAQVRSAGVRDAMAEFGITSELEIIDGGGIEMTTNEQRITAYLLANPDVAVIMGAGGICTDRLTSALKNAGKQPGEVIAGGFDAAPGTVEGLKTDYLVASIDQQQYLQGYFAVITLFLYNKFGLTPNIDTGGYLITKDNLGLIEELSGKYR